MSLFSFLIEWQDRPARGGGVWEEKTDRRKGVAAHLLMQLAYASVSASGSVSVSVSLAVSVAVSASATATKKEFVVAESGTQNEIRLDWVKFCICRYLRICICPKAAGDCPNIDRVLPNSSDKPDAVPDPT